MKPRIRRGMLGHRTSRFVTVQSTTPDPQTKLVRTYFDFFTPFYFPLYTIYNHNNDYRKKFWSLDFSIVQSQGGTGSW